ncbi:hypothetical protein BC629DRAFT_1434134 [Irpex lacteus]|nr:hypothetical protein BC629DRAFT_1434134 [Irpex lacteus]
MASLPQVTHIPMRRPKKKTSKQADGNDSDVVEIPKPSDGSPVKTKSKSKGKARANITFLDGPIKMPAANVEDKNKPGPIVDPEYNPFVSDDEMEIDKPVEENSDASPRKKMKTVSGKAKATKTSPRKNKKEHDTVNDTPVTGMSRIIEKSAIVSDEDEDEEDDELPTPHAAAGVERVSDPNNPDHASLMCKYMKAAYRSPYTPPPITDARTILLRPPLKVPISFVNFGDAMRAVGVKKDSPLWKRFFTIVTQDIYGPFTYNLARIDPNLVRMNRGTGQYATPTFNILKNISLSNGWSATAGVAFVMFGSVSLSYLLEGQLVDGRWGRFINIRLLPMEFYRAMNILASKFGLQELAAARFNGFKFGTVPTKRKYGEEVATPRKRRLPKGDESEEPEIDVPSASVGGKEIQRVSPLKTRAEIQTLAGRGRLFNTDDIPIYDYTDLLNEKELPKFNQELLHGAKVWTRGEIPEDSWVCVHYVPNIQWNVLRIVVLALPVPEDD